VQRPQRTVEAKAAAAREIETDARLLLSPPPLISLSLAIMQQLLPKGRSGIANRTQSRAWQAGRQAGRAGVRRRKGPPRHIGNGMKELAD